MLQSVGRPKEQGRLEGEVGKLKGAINKVYAGLIGRGVFTREAVIGSKRDILGAVDAVIFK